MSAVGLMSSILSEVVSTSLKYSNKSFLLQTSLLRGALQVIYNERSRWEPNNDENDDEVPIVTV